MTEGVPHPGFDEPPDPYPETLIAKQSLREFKHSFQSGNDFVTPEFSTVAGTGGMGSGKQIDDIPAVVETIFPLIDGPVIITGGGMNTPMGAGFVLGKLVDISETDATVKVTVERYYSPNKNLRDKLNITSESRTSAYNLGAYEISVPQTPDDYTKLTDAVTRWLTSGDFHLDPKKQQIKEAREDTYDEFDALTPGDTINTPAYSTALVVVSHVFDAHVILPRGQFDDVIIQVRSVTVSNPRGGYYQIGIEHPSETKRDDSLPTWFISSSSSSPPTPNTAFRRDERFDTESVHIITDETNQDIEIVEPNEDVLNSLIPDPKTHDSLTTIDGIGEKTSRELFMETEGKLSVENVAWTLFGTEQPLIQDVEVIRSTLEGLPRGNQILTDLKEVVPVEHRRSTRDTSSGAPTQLQSGLDQWP